ncbi:MAG: MFS transporter [Anaerolineales bacterium]|nr:MFS transporter [Anaerolineales bacterium]
MSKSALVFVCFTAAYFLSYFYRSANAVIAPDLSRELGLRAEQLGLMTSLFFATFATVQLPLGAALDRYGPRWVTPGLMLASVAGSLLFAVAPSFGALALGRALIGAGMAGVLMGALKAFSQWFEARRYSTVSGLLIGLGSSGALIAATPLAWFNAEFGWRSVFVYGAAIILLVAVAIALLTRNTPPGVPWVEQQSRVGLRAGLRQVFGDLRFWRIAPLIFFTNGALLAFQGLWAGPYLFDVFGLERVTAGNLIFLLSLGVTLGFLTSGWLADRLGLARVVVAGTATCIVAQLMLALQPPSALLPALMFGLGLSGGFSILLLVQPRFLFPPELTGRAATGANVFSIGGTFILQALLGVIIGAWPRDAAGHYPPEAYAAALTFTALGMLATLAWYWPMLRQT